MDDTEIDRCIAVLVSYWPMPEQTQGEVLALNQILERWNVADFDRTVKLLVEQGRQFRPAPGELAPLIKGSHYYLEDRGAEQPSLPPAGYEVWADEPPPASERFEARYRCNVCQDTGFKAIGDPAANTVKPCPSCRSEQHAAWARGRYMPSWLRGGKEG